MGVWKYYLLDNGRGEPHEIYRLLDDGKQFYDADYLHLYLARKSGEWSNHPDDVRGFLNASRCGDFDPDDGEITEEQAITLLESWRTTGLWPGRE